MKPSSHSLIPFLPFLLNYSTVISILILVKVKFTVQLTVYRKAVRLGGKPLENHDQNFLTEHFRVCSLQLQDT
jgi:hypothetical protein